MLTSVGFTSSRSAIRTEASFSNRESHNFKSSPDDEEKLSLLISLPPKGNSSFDSRLIIHFHFEPFDIEKSHPFYTIRRLIIQVVAFASDFARFTRNRPRRRRPRIATTNLVVSRVEDATLVGEDEPGPRGSRAIQGRQGRGTVWTAEHEGRAHRWPATSGAVPVELKVAEVAAVHPAVALVRLALLLQHHTPPFRPRVLEPDLGTRRAQGSAVLRYVASHCLSLFGMQSINSQLNKEISEW